MFTLYFDDVLFENRKIDFKSQIQINEKFHENTE